MATKPRIIAEDVLLATHFIEASEQEGVYLGQPDPDDDNSGSLRLVSIGPDFMSMALDATPASGDQDTVFPITGFGIYGDDYFNNCTVRALKQVVDGGDTGHLVLGSEALSVTDMKKFGKHGLYFNGSSSYASAANHNNWDVQTNFSISLFAKHTDHVGDETYVTQQEVTADRWVFYHSHGVGLCFAIVSGGPVIVTLYGGEIADANWHHVLLAKVGNEYGLYLDGVQRAYKSDADMDTFAAPLYIGQTGSDTGYFDGHMDEVVIYHGNLFNAAPVVGLTDTITVPTVPHVPDTDTKLYLNGEVEERVITDFEQGSARGGTVTLASAFPATLASGEIIQVTKEANDFDFKVELTNGGDTGDAKFKWSHDGGDNYFGRVNPGDPTWLASAIIATSQSDADHPIPICQAQNGDLVGIVRSVFPLNVQISSDNGLTWGTPIEVRSNAFPHDIICLSSGRLLISAYDGVLSTLLKLFYSDDNGLTWTTLDESPSVGGSGSSLVELPNGNVIFAYDRTNVLYCKISTTGGISWGSEITIASDANYQRRPSLCMAKNGSIVCVYESDEDAGGEAYEVKGAYSTDGGLTWTNSVAVIDEATSTWPDIVKDIDGTLYATCVNEGNDKIRLVYSDDNGLTWNSTTATSVAIDAANGPRSASLVLLNNQSILCSYHGDVTNNGILVRTGIWEKCQTMATNACPCAIENFEQYLISGAKVKWAGYAGIEEDKWDFGAEAYYAKENLLLDSPSLPWRSEQDNVEASITIDLGAYKGHPFDAIGLFGCNIRRMKIQASPSNDAKAWELPPVDEEITFDLDTKGVVDSVASNYIEDVAFLADYKDHELRKHYFQMTSGTNNGRTYKIIDNVGDWFELLSKSGIVAASVGDTFAIFKTGISSFLIDPDTTEWADVGSMEIGSSNAVVQNQDIAGSLTLNSTASTCSLARIIVGGNVHCATYSSDNFILGLQCAGTITDNGARNTIVEGGWFDFPYRYIRILVEVQSTYEGYYQIGNMVLAKYTELSKNWRVGYNLDSDFGVEMIRTPHGGLSTVRKHDEIKRFNLSWHQIDDTNTEITKLIDYIGGRNFCLIPDGDIPTDCYLTKFNGTIKRRHALLERFDTSLVLEEVR